VNGVYFLSKYHYSVYYKIIIGQFPNLMLSYTHKGLGILSPSPRDVCTGLSGYDIKVTPPNQREEEILSLLV